MSKHAPESAIRAVAFGSHGRYGASILGPRDVPVAHFSDAGTYGRDGSYSITRTEADATAKRMAMCYRACEGMGDMRPGSVRNLVEAAREAESILDDVADTMPHASDTMEKIAAALRELGENNHEQTGGAA